MGIIKRIFKFLSFPFVFLFKLIIKLFAFLDRSAILIVTRVKIGKRLIFSYCFDYFYRWNYYLSIYR